MAANEAERILRESGTGELTPEQLGVEKLVNLADITLASWPREECPLCQDGVPVNTAYAHGADFVAAGGEWP